jgi:hypothetical protein
MDPFAKRRVMFDDRMDEGDVILRCRDSRFVTRLAREEGGGKVRNCDKRSMHDDTQVVEAAVNGGASVSDPRRFIEIAGLVDAKV